MTIPSAFDSDSVHCTPFELAAFGPLPGATAAVTETASRTTTKATAVRSAMTPPLMRWNDDPDTFPGLAARNARKRPSKGALSRFRWNVELAVDDGGVLAPAAATRCVAVAKPAPARPEDERSDEADGSDHDEDDTGDLQIDSRHLGVDGPCEDRTDGDQEDAETDSHDRFPLYSEEP